MTANTETILRWRHQKNIPSLPVTEDWARCQNRTRASADELLHVTDSPGQQMTSINSAKMNYK